MKSIKAKKKAPPKKGNFIGDEKPENSYKKVAKAGQIARAAGKKERPRK